jgi:hypothetical protein
MVTLAKVIVLFLVFVRTCIFISEHQVENMYHRERMKTELHFL